MPNQKSPQHAVFKRCTDFISPTLCWKCPVSRWLQSISSPSHNYSIELNQIIDKYIQYINVYIIKWHWVEYTGNLIMHVVYVGIFTHCDSINNNFFLNDSLISWQFFQISELDDYRDAERGRGAGQPALRHRRLHLRDGRRYAAAPLLHLEESGAYLRKILLEEKFF